MKIIPYPSGIRCEFAQNASKCSFNSVGVAVTAFHLHLAVLHAEDKYEACDL